jgi:F-type H+-transporting ATPase subunit epsilon
MAATFHLDILTPGHSEFSGEAVSLVAPGSEGYLGILAHHAPLITVLAPGHLDVRGPDGGTHAYHVTGGFLEVSANHAIVLADSLEEAGKIDVPTAAAAVESAKAVRREMGATADAAAAAQAENELAQARARLATGRRARGES